MAVTSFRVRPVSRRTLLRSLYAVLVIAALVPCIGIRTRLPQTPLIDDDVWGYLNPALSKLAGGPFQHTYGRDFLYPGFVYLVLRVFGDFRAIAATQHVFGILSGALLVVAWERLGWLLRRGQPISWKTRFFGLLVATTYATSRTAQIMEHTVRPEAIYPFFVLVSILLNLEFIARYWIKQERGAATAWLGGAGIFVSVMLYHLKPSTGFAVGFANLPMLISLFRPGMAPRRKALMAGGGAFLAALLIVLPESRLRRADPMTPLFLPNLLLTIHADMIRDQLSEDLKSGKPLAYPRDWLTSVRDRLTALIKTSSKPANHPYSTLGFNPDYLCYMDYVFKGLEPHASEGGDAYTSQFSYYYYRRTALHHPARMSGKVFRQLDTFYHFERLLPGRFFDGRDPFRADKETLLAEHYETNLPHTQQPGFQGIAARYPPARKFAEASANLVATPKKISQRTAFTVAQNLLTEFYTPILFASLLGASWMLARRKTRRDWLLPTGVLLLLYSYNLGTNLTVSVVHSLEIGRYLYGQLAYTLLSSAAGLLFLNLLWQAWFPSLAEDATPTDAGNQIP